MRKKAAKPEHEIIRPKEYEISAEGVAALPVGSRVNIHGCDTNGASRILECTVAGRPQMKFLTYRILGEIKFCKIKEYPGKTYMKVV